MAFPPKISNKKVVNVSSLIDDDSDVMVDVNSLIDDTEKKSPLKNGLSNGLNGSAQSISPLPLQEDKPLIVSPKDVFGFDKFSEFHKPEANPQVVVPTVKPQSIAEAHDQDKNLAGNLWNSLVSGVASLGAGIADVHAIISVDDVKAQRETIAKQRESFIDKFGVDVTPEEKAAFDENIFTSTAGGLVSMIPAIPGRGVGLFIQAYDMAGQSIDQSPKGKDLPEGTKTIYKATVGVVVGAMDRVPIVKLFFGKQTDKVAAGISSKVLTNLIKTSKVPITAKMAEAAVTAELRSLKNTIIRGGKKVTTGAVLEGLTETGQEGFTMFAEEVLNKTQGEEIFEEQSWKDNLSRLGKAAAGGILGGTALGSLSIPFNNTRNYIAEKVAVAKSPEDIVRLKQELIETAETKEDLSDDEKMQFEKTIDDYVRVNNKIPTDIENDRVELSEKIIEKEDLQNEVTKKLEEVTTVEDAFKPLVRSEMEALQNRADEVNDEIKVLSGIVEDTKPTETVVSEDKPIEAVITSEVPKPDTEIKVEENAPASISINDLMKQDLTFEQKYKEVEFNDPILNENKKMSAKSARTLMEKRHNILDKIVNCLT